MEDLHGEFELWEDYTEEEAVGKCTICDDEGATLVRAVLPVDHDHYVKKLCEHAFCRVCMSSWIGAKLSENSRVVPCPHEGCDARLLGDDIARIDPSLVERYTQLMAQDHRERMKTLETTEPELFALLQRGTLKNCPECGIILVRGVGCSQMQCTCGAHFCYTCLKKDCNCMLDFAREEEEGMENTLGEAEGAIPHLAPANDPYAIRNFRYYERELNQIERVFAAIEQQQRAEAEAEARGRPDRGGARGSNGPSRGNAANFVRLAEVNRGDLPLSRILALAAQKF